MTRRERLHKYDLAPGRAKLGAGKKAAIAAMILGMTVLVYLICFAGRTRVTMELMPENARARVVSAMTFEYPSEIRTKSAREKAAERVPAAYNIAKFPESSFTRNLQKLVEMLNARQLGDSPSPEVGYGSGEGGAYPPESGAESLSSMPEESFLERVKRATGFNINAADLPYILSDTTPANRQKVFWLVITPLKEIVNNGIYEDSDPIFSREDSVFSSGASQLKRLNKTAARAEFRSRLNALGISESLSDAFYRTFIQELRPNIVFDESLTQKKREEAMSKVKTVYVTVTEGETVAEPGRKLSPLEKERRLAYIKECEKDMSASNTFGNFTREITICFLLMFSAMLFIVVSKNSRTRKPKNIILFAVLLLLNLFLERGVIWIADASPVQPGENWVYIFTYGTPVVMGPILQVLLCSAYMGFVLSLILSVLTTMMLGHNIDFFVLLFASSLVAIFYCNGASTRKQVIVGGIVYGAVLAFFSFIMGITYDFEAKLVAKQAAMAMFSGVITGILATVVLPVFESLFKMSSNITLLEFTDYNNPLLRMLQMEAPGTYHHSLMVAQIAEQAAVKIGANPLACTVGALYHDVGKVVKPEFFAENQASSNPHDTQTPSMSALIIKSHIRDGIDLARRYKMPPQVLEAISQHHGNSVISYFYNKAMNLAGAKASKEDLFQALRDAGIEESTFRHEGRRPQTTETAILMLADSCEAASRSLRRVTLHSIEELVDKIFQGKMNDGQLDESPITLKQLAKVRESFVFTLQNMLHSRVEYNTPPAVLAKDAPKARPPSENPGEKPQSQAGESAAKQQSPSSDAPGSTPS